MAVAGVRLFEDVIFASCGLRKAGSVVTVAEAGESWQWCIDRKIGQFIDEDDMEEAMAVPDAKPAVVSEVANDEVTEDTNQAVESSEPVSEEVAPELTPEVAEVAEPDQIKAIYELLKDHKSRLDDIVSQSGLTEDVVKAVLTEANGFKKNQQGWWGLLEK